MKNITLLLILCLMLSFAGCDTQEEFHGLSLPLSLDEIEVIELIHHTGDPLNSQRKWITDSKDIHDIYTMLSSDILAGSGPVDASAQTDTLYITFHRNDGTGYKVKYECFGVKKGIIYAKEGAPDFTYFTSSDIGWIWEQLAADYEAESVSICEDPVATEIPIPEK